jgi:hypothetical protein
VISGLVSKWILHYGVSTHVSNGKHTVSAMIPIAGPTAVLTADGVKRLLNNVIVSIPRIEGFRNAVVAADSPN